MAQSRRSFVEKVDFITSFGHGDGGNHRERLGIRSQGPTLIVTDLCMMRPDPQTKELTVFSIHPGVTREQVKENTGWEVRFEDKVAETSPPTEHELAVLRDLQARTASAHAAGTH